MPEARRTFGPVVLVGVAAAVLSAVAGTREWQRVEVSSLSAGDAYASSLVVEAGAGQMPAANALALVLLACWGVLLVTRGRVRRAVAWLGLLAASGLVATVVTAWFTLDDQFADAMARLTDAEPEVSWTGWYVVAAVGALAALAASVAAVRFVGSWPEMGTRYDAPTGEAPASTRSPATVGDAEADARADESQELWKAIDEGRDPTDGPIS